MPDQSTDGLTVHQRFYRRHRERLLEQARSKRTSWRPPESVIDGEEWRAVVGFESYYEVSNLGRVRRIAACRGATVGHALRTFLRPDGRLDVSLYVQRARRTILVHILVATAFHPKPDYPCEVNHKDGKPANNRADNLEWVTKSENGFHAYRVLRRTSDVSRALNARRKLTPDQVREIRAATGCSQESLAERYGVWQTTISRIRLGRSYAHVK